MYTYQFFEINVFCRIHQLFYLPMFLDKKVLRYNQILQDNLVQKSYLKIEISFCYLVLPIFYFKTYLFA